MTNSTLKKDPCTKKEESSPQLQEKEKIANWVEALKKMPELRSNSVKERGQVTPQALRALSEKLADEFS